MRGSDESSRPRIRATASWSAVTFATLATLVSCSRPPAPGEVQDHPPSPQAQVMPAPLANAQAAESARADVPDAGPDAGPPAVPLRAEEALSDMVVAKENPGHALELVFRQGELPPLSKGQEISGAGVEVARRKTETRARLEISATRMRLVAEGTGFVFPPDVEIRARQDRLGHVLVAGSSSVQPKYRSLAPGALRAFFAERRLDVGPLDHSEILPRGEGPRRLGARTRRVELVVRSAKVVVDIAHVADAGEGGVLFCRFLLDLASALPRTPLCGVDEVPLYAEFRWSTKGSFVVEASSLARRPDVGGASLLVPPAQAVRAPELFPRDRAGVTLTPQELRALRHGDPSSTADLEVSNPSTALSVLWLDGVPVAWLAPSASLVLQVAPGRYAATWRSVFGDVTTPVEPFTAPGKIVLGAAPDAGK